MAKFYYGLNAGLTEYAAVTSSAGTTGKDAEIVIDNAKITDRETALLLVEQLSNVILRSLFPL